MPRVIKIEYDRNDRKTTKYILECGTDQKEDLVGLDITKTIEEDNRLDARSSFFRDTGKSFAFSIHRAIQSGYTHESVMASWDRDPDDIHRPTISMPGTWRIFKRNCTTILHEWKMDRTFA